MDSGTIAAIVALVVAGIALLVAFAQLAQQYIGTASLIRKCDSIVYGLLPGSGRRVWIWRQMRFKVYYASPCISLTAELWPELYRHSLVDPGCLVNALPTLDCSVPTTLDPQPGQAEVGPWSVVQTGCRVVLVVQNIRFLESLYISRHIELLVTMVLRSR
jgi:hypothetical protein